MSNIPVSIRTYGNLTKAQTIVDEYAKLLLFKVKDIMKFQNLEQLVLPTIHLSDGSTVQVQSVFGQDRIVVVGAFPVSTVEESKVTEGVFLVLQYAGYLATFLLSIKNRQFTLQPKKCADFADPNVSSISEIPAIVMDDKCKYIAFAHTPPGINSWNGMWPYYRGDIDGIYPYGAWIDYGGIQIIHGVAGGYTETPVHYGNLGGSAYNWMSYMSGTGYDTHPLPGVRNGVYTNGDGVIIYGIGLWQPIRDVNEKLWWYANEYWTTYPRPAYKDRPYFIRWWERYPNGTESNMQIQEWEIPYKTIELYSDNYYNEQVPTEYAPRLVALLGNRADKDALIWRTEGGYAPGTSMVKVGGYGWCNGGGGMYIWRLLVSPDSSGSKTGWLQLGNTIIDTYTSEDGYSGGIVTDPEWYEYVPGCTAGFDDSADWGYYPVNSYSNGTVHDIVMDLAHREANKYVIMLRRVKDYDYSYEGHQNVAIGTNWTWPMGWNPQSEEEIRQFIDSISGDDGPMVDLHEVSSFTYTYVISLVIDGQVTNLPTDVTYTQTQDDTWGNRHWIDGYGWEYDHTRTFTVIGSRVTYASVNMDEDKFFYTYVVQEYNPSGDSLYHEDNWHFSYRVVGVINYASDKLNMKESKEIKIYQDGRDAVSQGFKDRFNAFNLTFPVGIGEYRF